MFNLKTHKKLHAKGSGTKFHPRRARLDIILEANKEARTMEMTLAKGSEQMEVSPDKGTPTPQPNFWQI